MTVITTRLIVASDGAVALATSLPAGEYEAAITAAARPRWPGKAFTGQVPVHDEAWDDTTSLRREDLYDDEGRLR